MSSAQAEATHLADLLRREHHALTEFLLALSEFDRERRWFDLGHRTFFNFLVHELGLSKGAAYYRMTAAELVQRFPEVLAALREGKLCMTSIVELAKVLTPENRAEILPRFFHVSKSEAKEVTAALRPAPAPPLRTVVTVVPAESGAGPALVAACSSAAITKEKLSRADADPVGWPANLVRASSAVPDVAPPSSSSSSSPSPPRRAEIEPLTGELRRIHVTVSRRLLDKLAAARDALSHSHPGASDDEILEVGLDLILQRHAKRRGIVAKPRKPTGATEAPRAPGAQALESTTPAAAPPAQPPARRSRHVPAAVARAVWKRDHGRCQWSIDGGGICGETYQVQIDHIDGWALGAGHDPDRLRLLCRVHQDVHARRLYGDDLMDRYTGPKAGGCSEPVAEYAAAPARGAAMGWRRLRSVRGRKSGVRGRAGARVVRTAPVARTRQRSDAP